MKVDKGSRGVATYAGALIMAGVLFSFVAPEEISATQTNTNNSIRIVKPAGQSNKPIVLKKTPPAGQTPAKPGPAPAPSTQPAKAKQTGVGGASQQTGGAMTQGNQIKVQPGANTFTVGIPDIGADLSASRYASGEFVAYEKKQSTTTSLYFKLITPAKNAQKIVWQVSSQPFAKPKDGLDWKTPAGLLTNGEAQPGPSATIFSVDFQKFLGNATEKPRFIYVRALPIKQGILAARPSNDVLVIFTAGSSKVDLPPESKYKPKPRVDTSVSVIAYKPPVTQGLSCNFILTSTPPQGELKMILSKIKATTPGAKFSLCPGDYEYLKKFLTPAERLTIAFQDFLKVLKAGYNWLDDKYNYVENGLVDGLVSMGLDGEYARKAINYYKAIYGLNPSYGNFDESLDHGKQAFAAHLGNSGQVSDQEKEVITEKFNEFVEEVRKQANGGGDPNRFYRADPDYVPRPFYVVLRVKYTAVDGAPANMVGGKRKLKVMVTSGRTLDKSTLNSSFSSGYQEWAPVVIGEKQIELPDAKAGSVFNVPVYVDYSALRKTDEYRWTQGYNSLEPGKVEAGGGTLKVIVSQKHTK